MWMWGRVKRLGGEKDKVRGPLWSSAQTSSLPLAPIPPVRASDLNKSHHPKPSSLHLYLPH